MDANLDEKQIGEMRRDELVEIQRMGLIEHAQHDFNRWLANAMIEKWAIGYALTTNIVWCDVHYHLTGSGEILQQQFSYTRAEGKPWTLVFGVHE